MTRWYPLAIIGGVFIVWATWFVQGVLNVNIDWIYPIYGWGVIFGIVGALAWQWAKYKEEKEQSNERSTR